jgi:translation initiation factor IF-2
LERDGAKRMRIYELAKQLNVKSEVLVDLLLIAGHDIKGHMSRLDDKMLVEISGHFKLPPDLTKKARSAKAAIEKKEAEEAKRPAAAKTKVVKARVEPKVTAKVVKKPRPAPPVEEKRPEQPAAPEAKETPAAKEAAVQVESKPAETVPAAEEKPEVARAEAQKPEPVSAESAPAEPVETPPREAPAPPGREIRPESAPGARVEAPSKPGAEAARPPRPVHGRRDRPAPSARPPIQAPPPDAAHRKADRPKGPRHERPVPQPPSRRPKVAKRRDVVEDVEAQQKAVRESVRRTLAKIETTRKTRRRKTRPSEGDVAIEKPAQVTEGMTVRELGAALKIDSSQIVKTCLELGLPVTINQTLDRDTIELLADEFGKRVEFASDEYGDLLAAEKEIDPARLKPRAPVVTIMGHVDHGKTSILDRIRKTNVVAGEAGGITQHVGAYEVDAPTGKITFIDTPGHEAFTSMRARGAQVTDIVVLVVAADDGVMPQTVEAINHSKEAGVPIIVAVNKIDLPTAKPLQVKKQLADTGVVAEEYGGDVITVDVSARTGDGIDRLLEMILLQADVMELKADPEAPARGVAVEVRKEEGRGILCTVLVTQGTLRVGDTFVIGRQYGKVRALFDHRAAPVRAAPPSTPVVILGCNGLPVAGDRFMVVTDEREARDLSLRSQVAAKEREKRAAKKLTLDEIYSQFERGDIKELRLVIKGDTNGSIEALSESLSRLTVEEIGVKVVHSGVGVVNESDVLLAGTSDAIIIAFNVRIAPKALELADSQGIEIRSYEIIYECISDVLKGLQGMLEPEKVERILGKAEVRQVFKISKLGTVAGCIVLDGTITRNAMARVYRDEEMVYDGRISSLKRFQDDVREVQKDFECGIGVGGLTDLLEGDIIEAYVVEEKVRAV